jgi:hypothetical protein
MSEKRYSKKQREEMQMIERDITLLQNKLTKDVGILQEETARKRSLVTRACTDRIKDLNTKKKIEQEKLKSLQNNEEQVMRRKFKQQQDDLNKEFVEPFIREEKELSNLTDGLLKDLNQNLDTLQKACEEKLQPLRVQREAILAKPIGVIPEAPKETSAPAPTPVAG